jgi:hypothetical protein
MAMDRQKGNFVRVKACRLRQLLCRALGVLNNTSCHPELFWSALPFSIQGGCQPADFRITVFATNLYFPLGMARLSDGSILVGVSQEYDFWAGSIRQIIVN